MPVSKNQRYNLGWSDPRGYTHVGTYSPTHTRTVYFEIVSDLHTGDRKSTQIIMDNDDIHGVKNGNSNRRNYG
jgi:hypothetical protein